MPLGLQISSCLFALMGGWVVVMNWACLVVNSRNQRRGIDHHASMVPVVAQGLFLLAGGLSSRMASPFLSRGVLLAAALADISLWILLSWPFLLLLRRPGGKAEKP